MGYFTAVMLGLLQGAAEFLPISSSGHLVLAEVFFKVEEAGLTFDVALHMGTLIAVLLYFCGDIWAIVLAPFKTAQTEQDTLYRRSALFIVVATVPAAVTGYFLEDYAATVFRHPALVAGTLVVGGLLLLWAEKHGRRLKGFGDLSFGHAVLIGAAQALAIIPGMSRSGMTMMAGLFMGYDRTSVARFSFLLSAPIIAGAGLLNGVKIIQQGGLEPDQVSFFLVGFISAALSGYLFITFLMKYIQTRSFAIFAYYRFILAALVLLALAL